MEIGITIEWETTFRLALSIVPDSGIVVRLFTHDLQLSEIGSNGTAFQNIHLANTMDDRTMQPVGIMVELQDASSIWRVACELEGHALADGWQVKHVAVGGYNRAFLGAEVTAQGSSRIGGVGE